MRSQARIAGFSGGAILNRRVLVTGGSGFIGTNIVQHHLEAGDRVCSLDLVAPKDPRHAPVWQQGDLLDAVQLARLVEQFQPQIVYHMGARTDLLGATVDDYAANTTGVSNMVRVLRQAKPQLAIFASTMLVCRIGYQPQSETDYCPSTVYGESKIAGERIVRAEAGDLPWVIVRPTSIWGPWFGSPYRDFFTAVARNIYVHPKGCRIKRNYGFVLNSVAQLSALAASGGGGLLGRTVYLADYEPIELKDWADRIQRALGTRPVRELPLWVFKTAAKGGDVLKKLGYGIPPMSSYRLNNILTEMIHDTAPLQSVLPALPYSLDQAIRVTSDWLAQHPA
jgi:nucleoside-diphosphate-sugar epimerase